MADAYIIDFKANIPIHLKYQDIISHKFSVKDKTEIEKEAKRLRSISSIEKEQVYYMRKFIGNLVCDIVNENIPPGSFAILDYNSD
jgi:hypothetical protein